MENFGDNVIKQSRTGQIPVIDRVEYRCSVVVTLCVRIPRGEDNMSTTQPYFAQSEDFAR